MLIWKKKIFWKEKVWNSAMQRYEDRIYIHPILAIGSIILSIPITWYLLETFIK